MLILSFVVAIVMGFVDSTLGMMYGTLCTPILILIGFAPKTVIPAVIFSQSLCDLVATVGHQKNKNGDFSSLKTKDTKLALSIVLPGIAAVVLGVFYAASIPTSVLNAYIGMLVTSMGILCISPLNYSFAWWKIWCIGILSSFNKAVSGGGFGPVTVTGKILGGVDSKVSVATTILSKGIICFLSFVVWVYVNGRVDWVLTGVLSVGAIAGALVGPHIASKAKTDKLRVMAGWAAILTGIFVLLFKMKA